VGFIPTFVFGLRPSTIDSMSEGSLSRVWEMPAIARTAQNRRAPSSSRRRNFEQSPQYGPLSLNCLETTAPRSCAARAQRRQQQARLAKPGTRRNRFLLRPMLCSAIAACPTQHGRS
jgi:hypothetical protein